MTALGKIEGRPPRGNGRPSSGARREGDVWGDVRGRLNVTASTHRLDAADAMKSWAGEAEVDVA